MNSYEAGIEALASAETFFHEGKYIEGRAPFFYLGKALVLMLAAIVRELEEIANK